MVAADAEGNKASPLVALLAGGIAGGVEAACELQLTRFSIFTCTKIILQRYISLRIRQNESPALWARGRSQSVCGCRAGCASGGVHGIV